MTQPGIDPGPPDLPPAGAGALLHAEPPPHEAGAPSEPVTLAESLIARAGWSEANFGGDGPNPPYLRIGGKLWITLTEYEPCFSSFHRDRMLFRSKVSMAEHLRAYDQIMIDPIAFEESFGPGEGTEATFPFGAWLTIGDVSFEGIRLWAKRHGHVTLPLEPLAVASAIWLRKGSPFGNPFGSPLGGPEAPRL